MSSNSNISVIIPVYNASTTIKNCLEALFNQTISSQIIVIDDGSTDRTTEIVHQFPTVLLLHQSHQGPAAARNLGVQSANGDIVVFIDADMTFDPKFIEFLTKPITRRQSIGTFTKEELVSNWDNPLAKSWNVEYTRRLDHHRLPPDFPDNSPVFRAILKSEFNKVGGFDLVGYTDDWTLSKKLGKMATVAPGAVMYHQNPGTLIEVWQQSKWIAKRRYKAGDFGRLFAFIRASFPFSLLVGIYFSIKTGFWPYLPFKLWYDLAITVGIIEYFITGKHAK